MEISIHPPRAGRDIELNAVDQRLQISIHPPRAGRDRSVASNGAQKRISIHPPRAGRDRHTHYARPPLYLFQSTLPVRGGTIQRLRDDFDERISIHPPRAGRDFFGGVDNGDSFEISIHPPRAGRDSKSSQKCAWNLCTSNKIYVTKNITCIYSSHRQDNRAYFVHFFGANRPGMR